MAEYMLDDLKNGPVELREGDLLGAGFPGHRIEPGLCGNGTQTYRGRRAAAQLCGGDAMKRMYIKQEDKDGE